MKHLLAGVLGAIGLSGSSALVHAQSPTPTVIVVTGTGRYLVPPDRATLSIRLESRASTAAAAATDNAKRQEAVLTALNRMGYGGEEARVVSYSVSPNYAYEGGSRRLVDYAASIDIAVAIADLKRLGVTIDAALSAGATEVHEIDFLSDSSAVARHRALTSATQAARADAEVLAQATSGRLGRLLELSTIAPPEDPRALRLQPGLVGQGYVSIAPRELDFTVTVYAKWEVLR